MKKTALTVQKSNPSLLTAMAARFSIEPEKMLSTLKATAFRGPKINGQQTEVTNEQMIMLLVVANQYNLNPFTREIYAFPDKGGGVVPIVGVDGWIRIMHEHPQFEALEFRYCDDWTFDEAWTEAIITRKDRDKPFMAREYLSECHRETEPWKKWPRRMLRHKAMIQCARLAFGFAGIHDPDEGERILESTADLLPVNPKAAATAPQPNTQEPSFATPAQCEAIHAALDDAGIPPGEACEQFKVTSFEELPFNKVTEVFEWIKRVSP